MAIIRIPQLCDSARLLRLGKPGEACVILKVQNVGSTGEHEILDKEGRCYRLKWETKHGGHIIRIPFSLWSQNKHRLAHDLMEEQPPQNRLVVLIEEPVQAAPAGQGGSYSSQDGSTPSPATISPEEEATREKAQRALDALSVEPPAPTEAAADDPLMYGDMPLHEAVAALVKDKAVRIKDVALQLDAGEEHIKQSLALPESKAELAAAGWVRAKNTTA